MGFFRRADAKQAPTVDAELANTQAGHDAARFKGDEDGLDRLWLAQSMYRTIKATPEGYSTRIGLYGEWGAGKTTVLNFLSEIAQAKGDVVVHVSAWRAVDADGFVKSLSDAMRAKIKTLKIAEPWYLRWKHRGAKTSSTVAGLSQMTGQAAGKIDNDMGTMLTMGAALTGTVATHIQQRLALDTVDLVPLRALLKEHHVVVFIDDLDRADPVILPKTLMALREYLDLPGFAFVLAFDKAIVTQSLKAYSQAFSSSRQAFLNKIIDFEFELRVLPGGLSSQFAANTLAQYCTFIPEQDRSRAAEWFPDNPRLTRTIARELGSLKAAALRHGPGELRWEAIILQAVLRREAPLCAAMVEARLLGKGAPTLVLAFNQDSKSEAMDLLVKAITASGFEHGSEAFDRYSRMVVKLQGLRAFDTPERIRSEMLLTSREPCFTQQEFLQLVQHWDQTPDNRLLAEALDTAANVACTSRLQAAAILLNLALDRYNVCIAQFAEQKSVAQRSRWIDQAEQAARFLWGLLSAEKISDLYRASSHITLSVQMLELFTRFARRNFPLDELWLRCIEGWMMRVLAERCEDQAALFFRCKAYETKGQGAGSMPPIVQCVYTATAKAAVDDAIGLFSVTNAIQLCSYEKEPSHRLELLRDENSMLYSKPHKAMLLRLFEGAQGREQQYILAKNALDYLSLLIDRNHDLKRFFQVHPDVLSGCWRLVIGEDWQQETLQRLHWLRDRLQQRGVDVAGLPEAGSTGAHKP
ncbi:KAP family P-loop NTPase fold protein [Pseudomonas sp. UM16]|uniref:KAP family P-loop NTPase fold protein n=1 Tax=Pseudomonas sp. UM16 TaxID=3158962 RepID=UPI00398FB32F